MSSEQDKCPWCGAKRRSQDITFDDGTTIPAYECQSYVFSDAPDSEDSLPDDERTDHCRIRQLEAEVARLKFRIAGLKGICASLTELGRAHEYSESCGRRWDNAVTEAEKAIGEV